MKYPKKRIKTAASAFDTDSTQFPHTAPESRSLLQDPFIHVLLIVALGFIVYFNTINVPFIFDDTTYLINNPAIKSFDCFPNTHKAIDFAIHQDVKNNLILRPVAYFTFAVNYALHGFGLFGYHLVNLLLHIGCGILVYCFLVLLLQSPVMVDSEKTGCSTAADGAVRYLSLCAALLFVCHPLQTQAVTYIIQRFVPLVSFFYLAALVLYLESRRASPQQSRWWAYIFSLIATLLAMESKETAFTLPLIIALVEFMFYTGNILSRIVRLSPFFMTMILIPVKLMQLPASFSNNKSESISGAINLVNAGGTSSWDYLMTQFGVVSTYLRLLFLPIQQNLDYDYRLQQSFFTPDVLLPLALLLGIAGGGIYLLRCSENNRLYTVAAFGIFWFFITLSVESSIVPIEDLIFEHRAYLPSIGFFISLLACASILFTSMTGRSISQSKGATLLLLAIIVALSATAIARNAVWQDEVAFWQDVVQKSPNKARAHINLGSALLQRARYVPGVGGTPMPGDVVMAKKGAEKLIAAATTTAREAIRLEPQNVTSYLLLAEVLMLQSNYDEALRSLAKATELQPKNWVPYSIRGALYEALNDRARAGREYRTAIEIEPLASEPHIRLSELYAGEGDIPAAVKELDIVMRINPDESVHKKRDALKKQ